MESYNILHARNELAHNNSMLLQASGIFCLWIQYPNDENLDAFFSLCTSITTQNNSLLQIVNLDQATPEEVHQHLMTCNLEDLNLLFFAFGISEDRQWIDDFIGQDATIFFHEQKIEIPASHITLDLNKEEDIKQWEMWLLSNQTSHPIEYYDPEVSQ